MLHDAADRLAQGAQPVGALDHADRWGKLWGLQAERSVALYAALRKYGEHGMYCNSRRLERTPCDCGLDAALATPEPQARQPEGEPRFPYQQPDNSGGSLSATLPEAPEGAAARLREALPKILAEAYHRVMDPNDPLSQKWEYVSGFEADKAAWLAVTDAALAEIARLRG
jgi:hypothetical protein